MGCMPFYEFMAERFYYMTSLYCTLCLVLIWKLTCLNFVKSGAHSCATVTW